MLLSEAELKRTIGSGKKKSTRMGFEPTRAEHIGLAVQRLNHSATSSDIHDFFLQFKVHFLSYFLW